MKIFTQQSPYNVASDMLVVPFFEGKQLTGIAKELDVALSGWLKEMMRDQRFEGKNGQTLLVHTHHRIKAKRVMLVGVGKKKDVSIESIRRAAGTAVQYAKTVRVQRMTAVLADIFDLLDPADTTCAFIEGARLAEYEFTKYHSVKKDDDQRHTIERLTLVDTRAAMVKHMKVGVQFATAFVEATILARDLINEPGIHMKPSALVKEARNVAKKSGVAITVLGEAAMKKIGMGAILAVSAGSEEEAYLVHLTYKPKKKAKKKIAICGKGITFDSGGLSLKPTNYMDTMKMDMAGAANILGLFSQIKTLAPDVEVHGVFAATENMPSGKATKPGDVITSYKGITIEVTNTDAEGRLILSDTLAWTEKTIKPDLMIDYATLTGAAIVALGQDVAAILGDDDVVKQYQQASDEAGEPTWQMPMPEEYNHFLKSPIADCANSYKGMGPDTIVGALFLKQFVEKTPWAHIDIAGPAWIDKPVRSYTPPGASGFGVRSLIRFVMNAAQK